MCGIAGHLRFDLDSGPPPVEILKRMANAIRHRGPDEFGLYRDEHAGLLNTRLAIVDLAGGQQPISNEDETLWVVFNGEIFNFIELRNELQALGHVFATRSDTEVIVHAFEQWGLDCFCRFNGQWAIALWDRRNKKLVLSRDRVGVRPLYVVHQGRRVWFGSEVKAIFADPEVPRRLNPHGIDQTFTYWGTLAPTTVFAGVEELKPGSARTYSASGDCQEHIYWRPDYTEARGDAGTYPYDIHEAAEMLLSKLRQATKLRMLRADVPVGSYLSGGLDSSLIARLGREFKDGEFRTFSLRFEDDEFDETRYQRLMASTLDCHHEEVVVKRSDIAAIFPEVIRHTERPILRTAPAPLYLLSKLVRQASIKAVLTGEGADEMLAGYDLFREAKIRRFWSRQPDSKRRPRLFERLYPYLARSPQQTKGLALEFWRRGLENADKPGFSHEPRWATTAALKRFLTPTITKALAENPSPSVLEDLPGNFSAWDPLAQAQYLELTTLFGGYIISSQGDRMMMANSVEGRFPFLDADVIAFSNSLPANYKLRLLKEKYLLKLAARDRVPEQIISRPKQPYRAPDAASFFGSDQPEYVPELFSREAVLEAGVFEPLPVARLYEKCKRAMEGAEGKALFSNNDNMAFVGILSTQLLYREFIRDFTTPSADNVCFSKTVDRIRP
jgi:asparagine synthase (glutamine-hydrolysing)